MSNSRNNLSRSARVSHCRLFASGPFKNVYAGHYTGGARAGEACVAKESKSGSVYEAAYFEEELTIICRTQQLIDDWHDAAIINKRILLNTPQIWIYRTTGTKAPVEPTFGPTGLGPDRICSFFYLRRRG
ncbi:putative elongation factor 2 kinase [Rosellinia necatrix]|uniref:Putative elongation factor 2 kinase n=1 Tax=Rosellinia necatrix TaxID=77044 RepID=A0A1S8A5Y2_ROSNE|nr:putative elongation factor 2 kinase [Rosellinia necatrix]